MNASIAIFGSYARADTDMWSDRDLLIVAESAETLQSACAQFRNSRWSVSSYTTRKLRWLADSGSLFIEHLRREAVVIQDPGCQIAEILSAYRPKTTYRCEFANGQDLLSLLESVPKTFAGMRWAFDVLAVAYRTMAVPFLAERDQIAFSTDAIGKGLAYTSRASNQDLQLLQVLRRCKASYRYRRSQFALSWRDMQQVCDILSKVFRVEAPLRIVARNAALAASIHEIESPSFGYYRLRALERGLIAIHRRNAAADSVVDTLMAKVKRPQAYCGSDSPRSMLLIAEGIRCLAAAA